MNWIKVVIRWCYDVVFSGWAAPRWGGIALRWAFVDSAHPGKACKTCVQKHELREKKYSFIYFLSFFLWFICFKQKTLTLKASTRFTIYKALQSSFNLVTGVQIQVAQPRAHAWDRASRAFLGVPFVIKAACWGVWGVSENWKRWSHLFLGLFEKLVTVHSRWLAACNGQDCEKSLCEL